MFELVKEIPVTFVPHELDFWAVGATLFAASSSLVVAMLAWRNGKKAVEIADAANKREERRLAEDARLRAQAERGEVVRAVLHAFSALELSSRHQNRGEPTADKLAWLRNKTLISARTAISAYVFNGHDLELLEWFSLQHKLLTIAALRSERSFDFELARAQALITHWGRERLDALYLLEDVVTNGENHGIDIREIFVDGW